MSLGKMKLIDELIANSPSNSAKDQPTRSFHRTLKCKCGNYAEKRVSNQAKTMGKLYWGCLNFISKDSPFCDFFKWYGNSKSLKPSKLRPQKTKSNNLTLISHKRFITS
jgi:hypothetical protein